MSGTLALSSPWCRQAIPTADERRAIEERIPDGYSVVLWAYANHRQWATYIMDVSGPRNLELVPKYPPRWVYADPHEAIEHAIAWIEGYDSVTYAGVEVPVR